MDIRDEIINSMDIMIQKSLEKNRQTDTKTGVVTGVKDGKYQVSIDGSTYNLFDSVGCNPKIGDGVFVQAVNGSFINAFITGLLKKNAKGGSDVVANPQGQSTDNLDKIQISGVIYDVIGGSMGNQAIVSVNAMPAIRVPNYVYIVRGDASLM